MKLLTDLYRISSPSRKEKEMIRFIVNRLKRMSVAYHIDKYGNIFATKGHAQTYACIVAHTDEVHSKRSAGYEVINFRDTVIFGFDTYKNQFEGIGADDKNGIWICLKCLEEYDDIKCVFFMGEEEGCIGSNYADMSFFNDCRYVLQCDRKGNSDFITSILGIELCSSKFVKDINLRSHDYKNTHGMQTDVATLKQRGLHISCANISCGYYNPHSSEEYTRIVDLQKCLHLVKYIIETCTNVYVHHYKPYRSRFGRYGINHFNGHSDNYEKSKTAIHSANNGYSWQSLTSRQCNSLLDLLSKRLSFDSTLTIDDLMEIYKDMFPFAGREDYETAYNEIMGTEHT